MNKGQLVLTILFIAIMLLGVGCSDSEPPDSATSAEPPASSPATSEQDANAALHKLWVSGSGNYDDSQSAGVSISQVKAALDSGADVNAKDSDGSTALMFAAQAANYDCVTFLVSNGALVNAVDVQGTPALMCAAEAHKVGDTDCVKFLLSKGAKIDAKDNGGSTALMQAAFMGSPGCVNVLISGGANVNARDSDGKTALSMAFANPDDDHTQIISILESAGAK